MRPERDDREPSPIAYPAARMTTIRAARLDEYASFVRLFPLLETTDRIPGPERWVKDIGPHTLFGERDGAVVAYLYGQTLPRTGYVRHLVVAPEARGGGLGRALMRAAGRRFGDRGCERWCLNVKTDNTVALGLYRSLGLTEAYPSTEMIIAWASVAALPPSSPTVTARPLDAADDTTAERAFDLPEGQLGFVRAQPGRVLVGLRDGGEWEGLACFDPAFPGAFPFRVKGTAKVRALLEALRPHALPGQASVRAVIDDGDAVVDALTAAGAEVSMRLLHLEGTLPTD